MTQSPVSMLATLSQGDRHSNLTRVVEGLSVSKFRELLDQITHEFEFFLKAIELINNNALETVLEQLLEAFTLKIGQILNADRTTIFLLDQEKQQLWSKVAQGEKDKGREIIIPITTGIAGHVAQTGESLNIPDAYSHPLFNPNVDRETGYKTRSILCIPILNRNQQVVAVVQLINKKNGQPFDQADEHLLQELASSIGVILESCNVFYMTGRKQRGAEALLNATACFAQSLDLEKTLGVVMGEARDLMNAERSTLFLVDRDKHELWSKVAAANSQNTLEIREIRIPVTRGIAGYVASTGQALNIPNAYEDPRFDPTVDRDTGYRTRNILCMPVFNSGGALIGVTQLINKVQGGFTSSDEEFMRAFNTQAGIALENAQLFESVMLEKQYQRDILRSLSDAVISTDLQGRIVMINEAALELLGCPRGEDGSHQNQETWTQHLVGRQVWEVVPIENLRLRVEESLTRGDRHYIPEQSLVFGLFQPEADTNGESAEIPMLVVRDRVSEDRFLPWNDRNQAADCAEAGLIIPADQVTEIERSLNLTVNPLTNPEGQVRGAVVVLEDISQEKRMKATMYRYMTPGVADKVLALGEHALMQGERRDVTILFSDIRGYTSLTEKLEASEVVSLLNNYFETMVEAVFNCHGTLDKFIGDALMAVFGAPLPLENHGLMAVQSALDMRHRLEEFNAARRFSAQPEIRIGIGISSGAVVSGNIGSRKRMDYTVIGDGVDISSRLEGVTKLYGDLEQSCNIILSEFTYQHCKDQVWVRELDRIRVKGKINPVSIYELLGDRATVLPATMHEFLDTYNAGRSAYYGRDFQKAIQLFEQAQQLRKGDRTVELHLERARTYVVQPPAEDWDGVHTLNIK
jgi:adenylate cyclase